jgi:hypothetical protein
MVAPTISTLGGESWCGPAPQKTRIEGTSRQFPRLFRAPSPLTPWLPNQLFQSQSSNFAVKPENGGYSFKSGRREAWTDFLHNISKDEICLKTVKKQLI